MSEQQLSHMRIVLVSTSHPGNIGAAARAMCTMGLTRLYLVTPKHFPHAEATARAAGADDILANAVVCDTLLDAVADCQLVIGTSSRSRRYSASIQELRVSAEKASAEALQHEVAVVFGCEQSGLSNEQMSLCHHQLAIPSQEDYHSLNLAAAVQVVSYELRMASCADAMTSMEERELAPAIEIARFYEHLEQTLLDIEALDPKAPRKMMTRLKQVFQRSRLSHEEVSLLRGILTAAQKRG